MTHQNLRLGKWWKLFWAILSLEVNSRANWKKCSASSIFCSGLFLCPHLQISPHHSTFFTILNEFSSQLCDCHDQFHLIPLKLLQGVPAIVNTAEIVPGSTVVVVWEPPFEENCPVVNYTVNYRKVMSPVKKSKWVAITVNANATSCTLQLNCKNEYDIAVTSMGENWQSALNDSKIWNFKTGGGKHSLCDLKKGLWTSLKA